jgi:two-component system, NarL family, nitrate/nitrite response regulator NarL
MELEKAVGGDAIRVLVADNSRIHTQLLADALRRDRGLIVIAEASGEGLIAEVVASNADVLLISSHLDEQPGRGFTVLHELHSSCPGIRAVVLLDSSKQEMVLDAFRAGARGIFNRHGSIEMLNRCIRCIHQGEIWADKREMSLAVEALASSHTIRAVNGNGLNLLSKREMQVVHCLAEGLTNREIAERLGLSPHTVKNYLFRVFDKLGVSSRVELLFMTLSQDSNSQSLFGNFFQNSSDADPREDGSLTKYQRAAEQGVPAAQLALAQLYWARRAHPKDVMYAYMWYSIAREQIARSSRNVSKVMTMEQLLEAEQGAAEWLTKIRRAEPCRVENIADRRSGTGTSASAD